MLFYLLNIKLHNYISLKEKAKKKEIKTLTGKFFDVVIKFN